MPNVNKSSFVDSLYGVVVRVSDQDVSNLFVNPYGVENFCVVFFNTSTRKITISFLKPSIHCLNASEIMKLCFPTFSVEGNDIFATSPYEIAECSFNNLAHVVEVARSEVRKHYDMLEIQRLKASGWQYFLVESSYHGTQKRISGNRYHFAFAPHIDLTLWSNSRFYESDSFISEDFSDFMNWINRLENPVDYVLVSSSGY